MAIEWCLKALRAVAGTGHTHTEQGLPSRSLLVVVPVQPRQDHQAGSVATRQ